METTHLARDAFPFCMHRLEINRSLMEGTEAASFSRFDKKGFARGIMRMA